MSLSFSEKSLPVLLMMLGQRMSYCLVYQTNYFDYANYWALLVKEKNIEDSIFIDVILTHSKIYENIKTFSTSCLNYIMCRHINQTIRENID